MAKNVIMPALGMSQEKGILVQWFKAEGESVTQGEPLMEVETDKATVEVESPASGVLVGVSARPGDEIPVGEVIALIVGADEPRPAAAAGEKRSEAAVSIPQVGPERQERTVPSGGFGDRGESSAGAAATARVLASPKARRLASELGLDLSALSGRGPSGAVLADDVTEAAGRANVRGGETGAAEAPAVAAGATVLRSLEVSHTWRVAAERVTRSWTTVPQFFLVREADAGRLAQWRRHLVGQLGAAVTYSDLLVKLVAAALRVHPRLNGTWLDRRIGLNEEINIGLAMATDDGLVVPVIHRADGRGLREIAECRKELLERARAGRLSVADLSGGTFTISNLGMYGVDAFNAIVNPPQAAILAVSRIADRVVAVNGEPAVRPMLTLTLTCDHRVVDGARGAQFLDALAQLIEEPLRLLD